ncbi:unnamed protein product [Schistocephalus solidus]|uniref:Uncharacterized protein n=1 Tax=Schistocephalus solidus TaxID=70667 RepID=A0A183TBM9_SCHSO|nr:unnamed protein product [Schistocephalus solidus]
MATEKIMVVHKLALNAECTKSRVTSSGSGEIQTIEKGTAEDLPGDVEQRDASVIITELPVPREDLPGDVEQRDASVIITELPVPLPFVEIDDGRVFEILRNLSFAPHLLEECCEFFYQPGPIVLVDFQ